MTKRAPRDRRSWTSIRVSPWKNEEVPAESMRFAKERVSYLQGAAFDQPLQYLLACAYLQGINDCVAAHDRNPHLCHADGEEPKR